MIKIYNQDIVEILPGCVFQSLVYSRGVVIQALSSGMAIVRFSSSKHCTVARVGQFIDQSDRFECTDWLIPFDKLKVLDSPHDTRLGELEEEILGLEADLVTARSCLIVSEELREQQHDLIEKLVEDIDRLKAEVYHLRNING